MLKDSEEIIKSFDIIYDIGRLSMGSMQIDIEKAVEIFSTILERIKKGYDISQEIQKKNPNISEKEYLAQSKKMIESDGQEMRYGVDSLEVICCLPKPQAKKIFTALVDFQKLQKLPFRTEERKQALKKAIEIMEEGIQEIKVISSKKQEE